MTLRRKWSNNPPNNLAAILSAQVKNTPQHLTPFAPSKSPTVCWHLTNSSYKQQQLFDLSWHSFSTNAKCKNTQSTKKMHWFDYLLLLPSNTYAKPEENKFECFPTILVIHKNFLSYLMVANVWSETELVDCPLRITKS